MLDKRTDQSVDLILHDDRIQRMSRTISVPARECRIHHIILGTYNITLGVLVIAIDVSHIVRLDECMIERGIEILLLLVGALYLYARQVFVPYIICLLHRRVEIPFRQFSIKVAHCSFYGCRRERNLHLKLLSALHVEAHEHSVSAFCLCKRQVLQAVHWL